MQEPVSGMDLKLRRIRLRVKSIDLAERAGWSTHANVSMIEKLDVVAPDRAKRYLDALATFGDVTAVPDEVA